MLQTPRQQDVDIFSRATRSVGNLFAFGKERLSNAGMEHLNGAARTRVAFLGGIILGRTWLHKATYVSLNYKTLIWCGIVTLAFTSQGSPYWRDCEADYLESPNLS